RSSARTRAPVGRTSARSSPPITRTHGCVHGLAELFARIAMGPWVVRYGQARVMAVHREEAGWTCGGCRTPAGFRACRRLRAGGCVRAVACGRLRAGGCVRAVACGRLRACAVIARSADGRNPGWRGEEMARYGGEYR